MKKRIVAVFLVLVFFMSSINLMAGDLGDLRSQYEDARAEADAQAGILAETRAEMDRIHQVILELDARMIAATDDLLAIDDALYATEAALEQTELEWAQAREDLDRQHEIVRTRLREIQERGMTGLLSVVLQATSLRDFLLRLEYVNDIARRDQEMVTRLEEIENSIAQMQEAYTRQLSSVAALQQQQEAYLQRLDDLAEYQEAFFVELAADEERYEALLLFKEEQAAEMHNAWYTAYQAEQARIAAEQRERERRAREIQLANIPANGIFQWPVPSSASISSDFGYRTHPTRRRREHHDGIDIRARSGSNIVAAESGTVILSGWHGGYGFTVIIDHGGGLHTLYGHNSRNLVSVGDEVSRGQVIALIGSTGVSTGPHLHFEMRQNGVPRNPRRALGLS
ncbi:MAG: peptidoglycan DD-metalloendopeptidase family protein [Defluviitaleaceae bacterium]|nr:peptidoglycan DD-metalloendopeptidase family protein [Defluviitaleaceae bacterium]